MLPAVGHLLVTNDDGVDSPALRPLLRALSALRTVRAVVPDRERSWIGKAITRWEKLQVRQVPGTEIYTSDGFPADCAQLGIHALAVERPDLVVSGINIGLNYGSSFFLSSGTVGAAIESWIAGVPAVAFSIGDPTNDRDWKAEARTDEWLPRWRRAAAACAEIVAEILHGGYPEGCDLLSVNMPLGAGPDTPRVVTELAHVRYPALFRHEGGGTYAHHFAGQITAQASTSVTDVAAVGEGRISITPVTLVRSAQMSSDDVARLCGTRARRSKAGS